MSGWRELRPGFWRRDVEGGWLGVKRLQGSWMWVHHMDGYRFASAQCFGLASAEAARKSADECLITPHRKVR